MEIEATRAVRCLPLFVAVLALASCRENVEEQAEAAGCPSLEQRVGMLFVRASVSDRIQADWQRDMQRYNMRRTPLSYSKAGMSRENGEASSAAARVVFDLVGDVRLGPQFDPSEWTTPEEIGASVVGGPSSISSESGSLTRHIEYFEKCSEFVGEYLISEHV